MFSYTGAEYVAVVYVMKKETLFAGIVSRRGLKQSRRQRKSVLKKSGTKFGLG